MKNRFIAGNDYKVKDFSKDERVILRRIFKWLGTRTRDYMFWIVYGAAGATDWEGGLELDTQSQFRNDFTINPNNRTIHCNFSNGVEDED